MEIDKQPEANVEDQTLDGRVRIISATASDTDDRYLLQNIHKYKNIYQIRSNQLEADVRLPAGCYEVS